MDAATIMADIKALSEQSDEQAALLQTELVKLYNLKSEPAENAGETDKDLSISKVMTGMRLSQVTKLRKFSKGENFSRYCERFQEFVEITKMRDNNLHLYFLQHVDDETYSALKSVSLLDAEKRDAVLFCDTYKSVIYGEESIPLKNEVMNCKQLSDEDISEFAYRLRDKANIAFSDQDVIDENCLLAFMRGVSNLHIKRKLNESDVADFNEALKLAKKLEKVESMLSETDKQDVTSILKESSMSFRPSRSEQREESPHGSRFRRNSGQSWRSSSWGSRSPSRSSDRDRSQGSRSRSGDQYRSQGSRSRDQYRSPGSRSGLEGQNRPQFNQSRTPGQSKVCWNCNKPGHIKRFCWSRNDQQSGSQQWRNNARNWGFQGGSSYGSNTRDRPPVRSKRPQNTGAVNMDNFHVKQQHGNNLN